MISVGRAARSAGNNIRKNRIGHLAVITRAGGDDKARRQWPDRPERYIVLLRTFHVPGGGPISGGDKGRPFIDFSATVWNCSKQVLFAFVGRRGGRHWLWSIVSSVFCHLKFTFRPRGIGRAGTWTEGAPGQN